MPWHLVFPLFSSIVFVLGMLIGKRALSAGMSPWTSVFWSNLWMAICWGILGAVRGQSLPLEHWWQAIVIGLLFVAGQIFNYVAFKHGDLSVATPIFGSKVIIVAAVLAWLGDESLGRRVAIGAALATVGVAFVQAGVRSTSKKPLTALRALSTVVLSLLSATCFSLFDVGIQTFGKQQPAAALLPIAFVFGGIISFAFLPWCDRPSRLRELHVVRPLLISSLLIAAQALSMSFALGRFGDATRINIIYSLRGLWAIGLAWTLGRLLKTDEAQLPPRILLLRLIGALLLTASVVVALTG